MFDKNFFKKLKLEYDLKNKERGEIIYKSNNILHTAKKTIFDIHRSDLKQAESSLKNLEDSFKAMRKKFSLHRLYEEGSFSAAAEEYYEAKALFLVVSKKKIKATPGLKLRYDSYLAGLCDLLGEMVRLATNNAAAGNFSEIPKLKNLADDLIAELQKFNFTKYLRTKYDQARRHLQKLEQINYEICLRKK